MKIQIEAEGRRLRIAIPTGLVFNKPMVWLWLKLMKTSDGGMQKYLPDNGEVKPQNSWSSIPKEAAYALCEELRRIRKRHGAWELVDVVSASGERVKIIL